MLRPKRNDKPVLLNLAVQVLEEVDLAVREQGVSRSTFYAKPSSATCATIKTSSAHFRSHLSAGHELGLAKPEQENLHHSMSALLPKADIRQRVAHVRYVPEADIKTLTSRKPHPRRSRAHQWT